NAKAQVIGEYLHARDAGRHDEVGLTAAKHALNDPAISECNAHQRVDAALPQAFDGDTLADKAGPATVDAPARGDALLLGYRFRRRSIAATLRQHRTQRYLRRPRGGNMPRDVDHPCSMPSKQSSNRATARSIAECRLCSH